MATPLFSGLVDPRSLEGDRQFTISLARGLEILRAFTPDVPEMANADLVRRTGLPKPTVSRLTYTLTLLGYLDRNHKTQKYRLGPAVLSFGYPFLANIRARTIARPLMEALSAKVDCSVNLGMRDRDNVVYIDSTSTDHANVYRPDIGSARPILAAAIGRALLVASGPSERDAIINYLKVNDREQYNKYNKLWLLDQQRFLKEGYFYSHGDWRPGVHAIAVPILNATNFSRFPLALNCTRLLTHSNVEPEFTEKAAFLKETASMLERALMPGLAPYQ